MKVYSLDERQYAFKHKSPNILSDYNRKIYFSVITRLSGMWYEVDDVLYLTPTVCYSLDEILKGRRIDMSVRDELLSRNKFFDLVSK